MNGEPIFKYLQEFYSTKDRKALMGAMNEAGERITSAAMEILENLDLLEQFQSLVIPDENASSELILEDLSGLPYGLSKIVEKVFLRFYENKSIPEREKIIQTIISEKNFLFWRFKHSIGQLVQHGKLSEEMVEQIITAVFSKNPNDAGLFPYYAGIESHLKNNGDFLFRITEKVISDEKASDEQLLSFLIGMVRTVDPSRTSKYESIISEKKFGLQATIASWETSIRRSGDQAKSLLEFLKFCESIPKEPTEFRTAYLVMLNLAFVFKEDHESLSHLLKWVKKNLTVALDQRVQSSLIRAIGMVLSDIPEFYAKSDELLVSILNQPVANSQLWFDVDHYVRKRLDSGVDGAEFLAQQVLIICDMSNPTFTSGLEPYPTIEYFRNPNFDERLFQLFQSTGLEDVMFAFLILGQLSKRVPEVKTVLRDDSLFFTLILFFQWRCIKMDGSGIARTLVYFDKAFEIEDPGLRNKFRKEIYRQAISYPSSCLEKWKEQDDLSRDFQEAVKAAESYFERRRSIQDRPALSFGFPGLRELEQSHYEQFNAKIRKGANEQSIFSMIATQVDVIYGSGFDSVDSATGPTELKRFQTQGFEMNRLMLTRPEEFDMIYENARDNIIRPEDE